MAVDVTGITAQVRDILAKSPGASISETQGTIGVRSGSAFVEVSVEQLSDENSIVTLSAVTNEELEPSPELFKYVATNADNWVFGHLSAAEREGRASVSLSHNLLGEFLKEEELLLALRYMTQAADDMDDEIKALFGGRRHFEDPSQPSDPDD